MASSFQIHAEFKFDDVMAHPPYFGTSRALNHVRPSRHHSGPRRPKSSVSGSAARCPRAGDPGQTQVSRALGIMGDLD